MSTDDVVEIIARGLCTLCRRPIAVVGGHCGRCLRWLHLSALGRIDNEMIVSRLMAARGGIDHAAIDQTP